MPVRHNLGSPDVGHTLARRPSAEFALTAAERKLLKNPDWIDEEEAALIRALREEEEHGLTGENIRDFAHRHGRRLKA